MTNTAEPAEVVIRARPKRADARRNYEAVIAAARAAFTESGAETSLEEIARRAGVGIGTLYRNFPNRQALLEAVYVDEVEAFARTSADLAELPPWAGLEAWLERFADYMVTKRALAAELFSYIDVDSPLFVECRTALWRSLDGPLTRAQAAGEARTDVDTAGLIQLFGQIAKLPSGDRQQIGAMLRIALDGLRAHGSDA